MPSSGGARARRYASRNPGRSAIAWLVVSTRPGGGSQEMALCPRAMKASRTVPEYSHPMRTFMTNYHFPSFENPIVIHSVLTWNFFLDLVVLTVQYRLQVETEVMTTSTMGLRRSLLHFLLRAVAGMYDPRIRAWVPGVMSVSAFIAVLGQEVRGSGRGSRGTLPSPWQGGSGPMPHAAHFSLRCR